MSGAWHNALVQVAAVRRVEALADAGGDFFQVGDAHRRPLPHEFNDKILQMEAEGPHRPAQ